jgi:hypothetical protein
MWRKAVVAQYNVIRIPQFASGVREREIEMKGKLEEPHRDKQFQFRNKSHKPPPPPKKKPVLTPRRRYWATFYIDDQPHNNDDKTRLLVLRT